MKYKQLIENAKNYRLREKLRGGVVVFYKGTLCGWMNELRSPEGWQPGCLAVDESGCVYKSIGGNQYDGADKWVLEKAFRQEITAADRQRSFAYIEGMHSYFERLKGNLTADHKIEIDNKYKRGTAEFDAYVLGAYDAYRRHIGQ